MNKYYCFITKWLYAGKYTKDHIVQKGTTTKDKWTENFSENNIIFLLPEVVESDMFKELFLREDK